MFTLLYFLMFVDCARMNTHPNLTLFLLALCARRTHSCQILQIFSPAFSVNSQPAAAAAHRGKHGLLSVQNYKQYVP